MTTLYGIKNCDSIKKARQWLQQHDIDYHFHDFREQGIEQLIISQWIVQLGWKKVVNKRSTTWKLLDSQQRDNMTSQTAIDVIASNPTLVKRPLLDVQGQYYVGFKPAEYQAIFSV
jgi:arsenate reductase